MIPTVEDILHDLAAGKCSVEQAMAWMDEHFDAYARQLIPETAPPIAAAKKEET
jgi:hypothetical protein